MESVSESIHFLHVSLPAEWLLGSWLVWQLAWLACEFQCSNQIIFTVLLQTRKKGSEMLLVRLAAHSFLNRSVHLSPFDCTSTVDTVPCHPCGLQ